MMDVQHLRPEFFAIPLHFMVTVQVPLKKKTKNRKTFVYHIRHFGCQLELNNNRLMLFLQQLQ